MAVLLMLMTIGGLLVAGLMLIVSIFIRSVWLAKFTVGGVLVWAVFYGVMLVGYSYRSTEKTLGLNQPKEFCGFYLDCHVHAEVTSVRTAKTIGDLTASGIFYIVGVRVFSNARNPAIRFRLLEPSAVVRDASGRSYARNDQTERLLPTGDVDLGRDIRGRETVDKEIVFDLPGDVSDPRLDIREGYKLDQLFEAFLIDDEDSVLHKHTYFDLGERTVALSPE